MSVKVLSDSEAKEILLRHPEVKASRIPSYGLKFYDAETDKDYLAGLVHSTGEIRLVDVTYYVDGKRIDADLAEAVMTDYVAMLERAKSLLEPFAAVGNPLLDIARMAASPDVIRVMLLLGVMIGGIWLMRNVRYAAGASRR